MQSILLVVHVLLALFLVVMILVQQGKGAAMASNLTGSSGGGSSQSVFGSRGAGSFMVKLTGIVALMFFVTTLTLNYLSHRSGSSENGVVESAQQLSQQQQQRKQQQVQQQSHSSKPSKTSGKQSKQTTQSSQNPAISAAEKQLGSGNDKQQSDSSK